MGLGFSSFLRRYTEDEEDFDTEDSVEQSQLPWLMLVDSAENNVYRRFYNLSKRKFRKIELPRLDEDPEDHRMYFSSKGWLVGVSRKRALIHFFHVFSSQLIVPPSFPILSFRDAHRCAWDDESYIVRFHKFVFSSEADDGNFQVAMVFDTFHFIAFWRPGQLQWTKPDDCYNIKLIDDVCFFKGEFYSIDHKAHIIAYGNHPQQVQPRLVTILRSRSLCPDKFYIVGLQTTLLVIHRRVCPSQRVESHDTYTRAFELFEVNVKDGKARKVSGIGDRALFIGRNSTFFVDVCPSDQQGWIPKPNCIYFTDHDIESYYFTPQGGRDMGIFSLEVNKVIDRVYQGPPQFNHVTPPMWLQLPAY